MNGRKKDRCDEDAVAREAVPKAALPTKAGNGAGPRSVTDVAQTPLEFTTDPNELYLALGQASKPVQAVEEGPHPDYDEALLERVRLQRDESAFEQLLARHRPRLFCFARQFVDWHQAEDLVQDAFLYLWRMPPKLTVRTHLGAWLRGIIRNTAAKTVTRRCRLAQIEAHWSQEASNAFGRNEPAGLVALWCSLAARLKPVELELLELRYLDRASYAHIAEKTWLSRWQVKRHLLGAKKKLRSAKKYSAPFPSCGGTCS